MTIFHCLPHIEKFLYCISLRDGSIIITCVCFLCVIEAIFGSGVVESFRVCYLTGGVLKVLGYISIAVAIIILFTGINFLYGIVKLVPDPGVRFMYACLLLLLFNLTASFSFFIEETIEGCCQNFIYGTVTMLYSLMICYFLVILSSYHRIMMFV